MLSSCFANSAQFPSRNRKAVEQEPKQSHVNQASKPLCYSLSFPGKWFSSEKGSLRKKGKWIIGLILAKKDTHQSDVKGGNPLDISLLNNTYWTPNKRATQRRVFRPLGRAKNNLWGQSCIFYDLINRRYEKSDRFFLPELLSAQTLASDLS